MRTCCGRTRKQVFFARKRTETALRVMQLEQEAEQRTARLAAAGFRRVLFFAMPPVDGKPASSAR
ncbi:MAG: hypothetical protein ACLVJB_08050 [Christensenellales bacterium]